MRLAEYSRAEEWLDRAGTLARLARDYLWVTRSHLRTGALFFQLGEHALARRHYRRAFWCGRCWGHRRLGALAAHDLFTLEAEVGTPDAALVAGERALDLYPVRDPRFPYFASDCGYMLLRAGHVNGAYEVLRDAAPLIPVADQAIVTGLVARAAGALQRHGQFDEALARLRNMIETSERGAAAALIEVAQGARFLERWELAHRLAADGLVRAEARMEAQKAVEARQLIEDIQARRSHDVPMTVRSTRVQHFVRRLSTALQRCSSPES